MYISKVMLNTIIGNFLFRDKKYSVASYDKFKTDNQKNLACSVVFCHSVRLNKFIPREVYMSFLDKNGTINIAEGQNDLFPNEYTEDMISNRKTSTFHLYEIGNRIFAMSLKFIENNAIFKTATFEEKYQSNQLTVFKTQHCTCVIDVKDKQQYVDMIVNFLTPITTSKFFQILKDFNIYPDCYMNVF